MTSLLGAFTNKSPVPTSLPYRVTPTFGQRGNATSLRSMENVGTVFSIVNRTSEAAASVEWKLYRKRTDGRRSYAYEGIDDRQEVTQHLALKVWNKPNPFMTRQEIVEVFAQHMCLTGEGWWALGKMNGLSVPSEIWPVRPDRMAIVEHPTDYLTAYEYRNPDGSITRLDPDEVIFVRRPNPYDGYRGIGPIQSVLAKIDSVRYSDEWNRSYFLNSAEPGGIIKINRDLDDDEFRRLQFRWNEAHKGAGNAHRVAILDGEEMDWVERQAVHRDMQFAELQQLNSEQIREAFGFPKPLLGTVTDVNRANAEAAEVVFARWVLVPLLDRIKAALNNEFLPLFGSLGEGYEFDYANPVPDDRQADARDRESKSLAAKTLIDSGVYGPEALEAVGMPPLAFGDPGADQDRQLLITLVTRAPTLAPTILPLLGFELPQQKAAAPMNDDNDVTEGGDPNAQASDRTNA